MTDIAVELRQVSKDFPGPHGEVVHAVREMQLEIRNGEFFSFLGPSGCGKTTTLRMIGGFEMPTSGQIIIGGEPMGYTPPYQRPVNTVFQNYALFPHMTVTQNVAFGLEMQSVDKTEISRRVDEALEMVHMGGMGKRKPKQLSGGQQQRVALARALINRPKVLLLDEPLGALDLKLRKAMQLELKQLQLQVGITFVYVTHDQEEALTMSDRIGVMNQGYLLQVASAEEIYDSPNSRFVSSFIGETNYIPGKVVSSLGDGLYEVALSSDVTAQAQGHNLSPQQAVHVAVRPEKLNLSSEAAPGANQAKGIVSNMVYMGSSTIYYVTLPDDIEVRVSVPNTQRGMPHIAIVGEPVTIYWEPQSSTAFAEGAEGVSL